MRRGGATATARSSHCIGRSMVMMPRNAYETSGRSRTHGRKRPGSPTTWSGTPWWPSRIRRARWQRGSPGPAAAATKVRYRVLAFTGLRHSELMRYRPKHRNRTTQTLLVYSGKGTSMPTVLPLTRPASASLFTDPLGDRLVRLDVDPPARRRLCRVVRLGFLQRDVEERAQAQ